MLPFLLVLLQTTVMAQPYNGTYFVPTSNGQITMTLQQSGDSVTGTLVDDQGTEYQLAAQLDRDGALAGELTSENGRAAIGAMAEEDGLYVNLIPFDANGEPLYEAAINVALERTEVDGLQAESSVPPPRQNARIGGPLGPSQSRDDFSGTFDGRLLGTPTTLRIEQEGTLVNGEADASGYHYTLAGSVDGANVAGSLADPATGGSLNFEMAQQENGLVLTLLVPDPGSGNVQRMATTFLPRDVDGPPLSDDQATGAYSNAERDNRIVGTWSYQDMVSGGGQAVSTQLIMQIHADGTFVQGDARIVGGGANWSGQIAGGGDSTRGEWRTENGTFYIRAPDSGAGEWLSAAQYELSSAGDRVLLVRNDGSKELWYRQP